MKFLYCINCSNIFSGSKCTRCHSKIDLHYDELINYAHEVVLYGYLYRRAYEKQYAKQKRISSKYSLVSPDSLFDIFTLMVLGGIIGNASYDTLKTVLQKIINKIKNKKINPSFREILNDEAEFKKFIKYVRDYYDAKKITRAIANVISEEKLCAEVANLIDKVLRRKSQLNQRIILKILISANDAINKRKKPAKKLFKKITK